MICQTALVTQHQTVAQLAAARNIDLTTVVDALTDEVAEDLADEVQNGRMTQDQADDRLKDLRGGTGHPPGLAGLAGAARRWRE